MRLTRAASSNSNSSNINIYSVFWIEPIQVFVFHRYQSLNTIYTIFHSRYQTMCCQYWTTYFFFFLLFWCIVFFYHHDIYPLFALIEFIFNAHDSQKLNGMARNSIVFWVVFVALCIRNQQGIELQCWNQCKRECEWWTKWMKKRERNKTNKRNIVECKSIHMIEPYINLLAPYFKYIVSLLKWSRIKHFDNCKCKSDLVWLYCICSILVWFHVGRNCTLRSEDYTYIVTKFCNRDFRSFRVFVTYALKL